ncbi:S-layer homology domain-containing protein [Paenibacillus eucommiae]|uniref:SLH domain-containing protein n=1 Tax=Paenibacillus eucommiae TaxID=1355755 RepID=A0ABS4J6X0_9BACL|nr:S-layer homology domain-containing protein [Paenibacillus eucommiae]MBP1995602.1 hypothetical protein [Paenibacillus eucommiae]
MSYQWDLFYVGGEEIRINFFDDRGMGTTLEDVSYSYTTDWVNWQPVPDFHWVDDNGFIRGTFRFPIDPAVTFVKIRVSAHYSPVIGSDSFPTIELAPIRVWQPGSASHFVATANTDGSVKLSWNDNSNLESYYQINRGGGKDGEKTFIVKDTSDHLGPLSFVDKETSTGEATFYLYTIIPVIDKVVIDKEVRPSVQFASVTNKPPSGIQKFRDKIDMSTIVSKVVTLLPKNMVKVDKDAIVQKLPDLFDAETIKSIDLTNLGEGVNGSSTNSGTTGNSSNGTSSGTSNGISNGVSGGKTGESMTSSGGNQDNAVLEELVKGSSEWAKPVLKQAIKQQLTTNSVIGNYQQPITREHFAGIAVKLYESLSGNKAEAVSPNPFTDTTSEDVLKASKAGIVSGIAADKFAPEATITRQELTVMILQAVKAAKPDLLLDSGVTPAFEDEAAIAPWAFDAVKFAYSRQIMLGVGGGRIDPLGNTTREQAIVLVKRAFEALK